MPYNCTTPDDVLKIVRDEAIEMVDLRFTDIPGLWQHFSVPPRALDAGSFADGVGFDGSSIRGFQEIQESADQDEGRRFRERVPKRRGRIGMDQHVALR